MNIPSAISSIRLTDSLAELHAAQPARPYRMVLWTVVALVGLTIVWALIARLDIIVSAEGKLVPQTLVKIVQPAEGGIVKKILVKEGDSVVLGQVLLQLDNTIITSERQGVGSELGYLKMQERRIQAELSGGGLSRQNEDDAALFVQVKTMLEARRRFQADLVLQEKALLEKATAEYRAAEASLEKQIKAVGSYQQTATAYQKLEKDGFVGPLAAAEKTREAGDKEGEIDAQRATANALKATIAAQERRMVQIDSSYRNELQKELTELRAKLAPMTSNLTKSVYRESLMELRAPHDGIVKEVATSTEGAVVQPGGVLVTIVPKNEPLFADVEVKNEDVGFVSVGQKVQLKIATYSFQKYGLIEGTVERISADSVTHTEPAQAPVQPTQWPSFRMRVSIAPSVRERWETSRRLQLTSGMAVTAEVHQGTRTVAEYLLSPVAKTSREAARER